MLQTSASTNFLLFSADLSFFLLPWTELVTGHGNFEKNLNGEISRDLVKLLLALILSYVFFTFQLRRTLQPTPSFRSNRNGVTHVETSRNGVIIHHSLQSKLLALSIAHPVQKTVLPCFYSVARYLYYSWLNSKGTLYFLTTVHSDTKLQEWVYFHFNLWNECFRWWEILRGSSYYIT